ncbi:MAG: phosphoglycerate mutase family protein [Hellea sp.]
MIRRVFLTGLSAALLLGCASKTPSYDATYYLVRHAEKTTEKPDPALTEDGKQRAQDLAGRLANIPLTAIYSSDYTRTRNTAAPASKAQGLDVIIYDPRDLDGFAKSLLAQKGHILVVGHSNTTPQLSALLGGEAGEPIVEATEYDRFYVLQRRGDNVTGRIDTFGK